ncbi:MAG TPA: hypothetical protein VGF69_20600 [Thermoanaerobaculia bacterium]|jgi:hypothetical protein
MRGRVTAVSLLLLLSLVSTAKAACTWSPKASVQFRSTVYDLLVEADLWTATNYGVNLYDRTVDPPALIDSIAIPGSTRVIRVRGGIAYIGSGSTISIVRYNGRALERLGGFDAGGTVNDLLILDNYLFAATSNGIAHFAIFSPVSATRTNVTLATSRADVTAFALDGITLYTADGDASVEVFNVSSPALPQKTGTIASLARPSAVAAANGRLYVSDGQSTDIFFNASTKAGTVPLGSTAFASLGGDVHFVAGTDRRFQAVDLTLPGNPVELFEAELIPSGGTLNRVLAMQLAAGRLYVAAGDAGLLTYDVSRFTQPYPLHGYAIGSAGSVVTLQTHTYVTSSSGTITELSINSSGALGFTRDWTPNGTHTVRDTITGFLLTSSGNTLTHWTLVSTTPTAIWSATFPDAIQAAAIVGTTAYALLADRTLWSASLSAQAPAPVKINVPPADEMARFGTLITLAEETPDGKTILREFGGVAEFTRPTGELTIDGVPTNGIAAGDGTAAVFTFRGINFVDFAANTVTVFPQSNAVLARKLAIAGRRVLEVTDRSLLIWDVATQRVVRELPVAEGSFVAATPDNKLAVIGTTEGVTSALLDSATQPPTVTASINGNAYYRKLAANGNRAYLFDNRGIDVFDLTLDTPQLINSIRSATGFVDLAAGSDRLFTLSGNGRVVAYSRDGYALGETTINDGPDTQPLAIHTAGNAVWVSISRGCLSAGCEKKTLVLDPRTLATTATLTGGVIDVVTSGSRAYALFDQPAEARVLNIADPLHPAATATRPTTANSIAFRNGTVYILGQELAVFNEQLQPVGSMFTAIPTPDPTQRVRLDGDCAIITGRGFNPATYTPSLPEWSNRSELEVPAAVRAMVVQPGRVLVLTDHSLEIWASTAAQPPARRRTTR